MVVARILFVLLLLTAPAKAQIPEVAPHAGRHAAPAATRSSANFDATYYHLNLDVDVSGHHITGSTRIDGRVVGQPLSSLRLDLDSESMSVQSVAQLDGTPLPFTHTSNVLAISLPEVLPPGEQLAVRVDYGGSPGRSEGGFRTFEFGERGNGDPFFWTLSEPYGARQWWPSKDHPSDKADSVRVTVTVPANMRVGSNGLLEDELTEGGLKTFTWFSRYPITTYLVSLAGGVYETFEQVYQRPDSLSAEWGPLSLPLLHYAYRDIAEQTYHGNSELYGWKKVTDVFPVLEYWFGPYPFPEEKYGHAHFTFGGGMEHQTMSSMGGNWLGLVTHELAHQWYGDAITMTFWPHLWLNEGFATYSELLYWEDRFPETYQTVFDAYFSRARNAQGTLLVTGADTLSVGTLFSAARVYAKGGMVLHMLRGMVGDDVFREILREYAWSDAVRYGTAVTADFQRVAENVSGRELDTFFSQWVTEGTGYPVYDVTWTSMDTGSGYRVEVTVEQTQERPISHVRVFSMPLTIDIETVAGTERFRVENDEREQTFVLEASARPTKLVFDPEQYVLRDTPVNPTYTGEPAELPSATRLEAVYPVPSAGDVQVRVALAEDGPAIVALYDVLGRRIETVFEGEMDAGFHDLTIPAGGLAGGTYLVRFTTQSGAHQQTFVIL